MPTPSPEDAAFSRLIAYQWPGYQPARHHRLIARHLEAVERGDITRLMIFMPPRSGKSMLVSEYFPAWYLGRNPTHNIIAATYAQELADDFGRKVRNQIADPSYRNVFPGVSLKGDSQSSKRFHVTQGDGISGAYFATGIGGPLTGRGGNLILLDDLTKNREEAESETIRQRNKDWYTSTAYTRLMPDGRIVLVMTRWHTDDVAGWLLSEQAHEGWTVLNLPAIAESDDAIGRHPGEALWPEAFPLEALAKIKQSIGSRDWSALYQQRPAPAEGGIFKAEWFRRYDSPQEHYQQIVQSWDTAYKPGEENDPSACTTWGIKPDGFDLLHVLAQRMEYPDLKAKAILHAADWEAQAILIEDRASGQSLIQDLRRETQLPVVPIQISAASGSKTTRAMAVAAMVEAGRLYLPKHAAWLTDFEIEMTTFPSAVHDDQCLVAGTKIATKKGPVPIELVCAGDEVLTPDGWRRVLDAGQTGESPVIERHGLRGTVNHPVFTLDRGYQSMDSLSQDSQLARLSLCGLIRTALLKSSCSTASHIAGWEVAAATISPSTAPTPPARGRKGFTSPSGSSTTGGTSPRATRSITSTATLLTTALKIWSAYRLMSIARSPKPSAIPNGSASTSNPSGHSLRNGTPRTPAGSGTATTPPTHCTSTRSTLTSGATTVGSISKQLYPKPNIAASSAELNTAGNTGTGTHGEAVYNLRVESPSCYYANGILVHNCDSTTQFLNWIRLRALGDRPMIRRL